ncbi:hypothetical protein TI04_12430 [Achromatium sp. WMS2]|nr:hypothetical protein TI04_12430 [Achromatium sp. WMS2]
MLQYDSVYGVLRTLTAHTNWVRSVAFSPDGASLASASDDNSIKLWRVADGELLRTLTDHYTNAMNSVAFSPDGASLASGSGNIFGKDDNTIKLWRVADGALLRTFTGHTSDVNSVAFSPDGLSLASGSGNIFGKDDNTIKLWRVADGKLLATIWYFSEKPTGYLTITPEGYFIGNPERVNYSQGIETYPELREYYYRPEGIPLRATLR